MSKEIPFFELFSQLKLSSELRLKLLGAAPPGQGSDRSQQQDS